MHMYFHDMISFVRFYDLKTIEYDEVLGGIQVLRHQRGGWVGQMMMFDDKVGGWGWLNDDVIKK